eukprot:Skav206134  [mRNA]  locus=scaffold172:442076:451780:+ [translate_table: standard]
MAAWCPIGVPLCPAAISEDWSLRWVSPNGSRGREENRREPKTAQFFLPRKQQVTFLAKLLSGPDEVIVDDPHQARRVRYQRVNANVQLGSVFAAGPNLAASPEVPNGAVCDRKTICLSIGEELEHTSFTTQKGGEERGDTQRGKLHPKLLVLAPGVRTEPVRPDFWEGSGMVLFLKKGDGVPSLGRIGTFLDEQCFGGALAKLLADTGFDASLGSVIVHQASDKGLGSCESGDLFLFVADGIRGRPYRLEVVEELQRWQVDWGSGRRSGFPLKSLSIEEIHRKQVLLAKAAGASAQGVDPWFAQLCHPSQVPLLRYDFAGSQPVGILEMLRICGNAWHSLFCCSQHLVKLQDAFTALLDELAKRPLEKPELLHGHDMSWTALIRASALQRSGALPAPNTWHKRTGDTWETWDLGTKQYPEATETLP